MSVHAPFPPGVNWRSSGDDQVDVAFVETTNLPEAGDFSREIHVSTKAGSLCTLRAQGLFTVAEAKRALAKATGEPLSHLLLANDFGTPFPDDATLDESVDEVVLTLKVSSAAQEALAALLQRAVSKTRESVPEWNGKAPLQLWHAVRFAGDVVDLDFERVWGMPAMYQTILLDQSLATRTGFEQRVAGTFFNGLGAVIDKAMCVVSLEEGALTEWSKGHPLVPVTKGDRILQVNGLADRNEAFKELVARKLLRIVLSKRSTQPPPPPYEWGAEPVLPPGCTEIELYVAEKAATVPSASDSPCRLRSATKQTSRPRLGRFRLLWQDEAWSVLRAECEELVL